MVFSRTAFLLSLNKNEILGNSSILRNPINKFADSTVDCDQCTNTALYGLFMPKLKNSPYDNVNNDWGSLLVLNAGGVTFQFIYTTHDNTNHARLRADGNWEAWS